MDQETSGVVAVQYCTIELDEQAVADIRKLDDWDAAVIYDARLVELEKVAKRGFIEMGLICLEVKKRELWKLIEAPDWIDEQGVEHSGEPFHSIDAWIMGRLGVSRRSAYNAMGVLKANTPLDDLREMPRVNAVRLSKLSSTVQADPAIIEAAKGSEKGFVAKLQKDYPDQHIEATRAVIATPELSARERIDLCFDAVCWVYDVNTREDVLELLCEYFMDGDCEREGYTQYKNREAYDRTMGRE